MRLQPIAKVLVAIGLIVSCYSMFAAYGNHQASALRVTALMSETSGAAAAASTSNALAGAIIAKEAAMRDLLVFGDAALFALIFLVLALRGSRVAPVLLVALPVLMLLILAIPYPLTPTGTLGLLSAFLTFDSAGWILMVQRRPA